MEKEYFIELLHKYLRGQSTIEEDALLTSYYNLFQAEPDVMAIMSLQQKEKLKAAIFAGINENISHRRKLPASIRSIVLKWSAAAALLIIAGLSLFYLLQPATLIIKPAIVAKAGKIQHHLFYLPDGSMVILSHGSKLQLAPGFETSSTRDIYLEGEAFFDISHEASRPFIVHTQSVSTTVLGTAFNVKAMGTDQRVLVTVSRGKVRVSEKNKTLDLLTPDQQIVVDKASGRAVKAHVKAIDFLQWKDQEDLVLDNVTFREAARLLEDRFGVSISFADKTLENDRFTTVLLKKEKLEQVIKSICEFNGASWAYNKNKSALLISNKE